MTTTTTPIERAKAHLATCMEREDWPSHNCACNCGDVSELLAEVDRLTFLHQQDHALADRYQEHREAAEREAERLRAAHGHLWFYVDDVIRTYDSATMSPTADQREVIDDLRDMLAQHRKRYAPPAHHPPTTRPRPRSSRRDQQA